MIYIHTYMNSYRLSKRPEKPMMAIHS